MNGWMNGLDEWVLLICSDFSMNCDGCIKYWMFWLFLRYNNSKTLKSFNSSNKVVDTHFNKSHIFSIQSQNSDMSEERKRAHHKFNPPHQVWALK
jgi:hypothetical protein